MSMARGLLMKIIIMMMTKWYHQHQYIQWMDKLQLTEKKETELNSSQIDNVKLNNTDTLYVTNAIANVDKNVPFTSNKIECNLLIVRACHRP